MKIEEISKEIHSVMEFEQNIFEKKIYLKIIIKI
jgi:hypothetical protein